MKHLPRLVCHLPRGCFYSLALLSKVQDFLRRFEAIPDLLELDHLTITGDVTIGAKISLKV